MISAKNIDKNSSDTDLLLQYQSSKNQEFLAALFLRYTDLIFGTCMKYLKNEEESKDAVMNIYQELVKKLLSHQVEHFKSWLYIVTKNYCLMKLRKEKNTLTVEFQPTHVQSEDFSHLDHVLNKESHLQQLEKCMERLNEEQHKVIKMFYLDNKCYNEIAETTKMDWGKIRSLIQNGRRNLKICMEKNG